MTTRSTTLLVVETTLSNLFRALMEIPCDSYTELSLKALPLKTPEEIKRYLGVLRKRWHEVKSVVSIFDLQL